METKLNELTECLQSGAGVNLKAVVLYGSAVTDEFHATHSDLNILCVLEKAGVPEIEKLHAAAEWWITDGNPAPQVFTMPELQRSADIFAIELLDMKHRHRMLYGADFFDSFDVPMHLHRLQVERELRTNGVRLRQAILTSPRKHKAHLGIMLASVSWFCVLFRHALFALGQEMPTSKRAAVDGAAAITGADPSGFLAILELRAGKRKESGLDVDAVLNTYTEFVGTVTEEVDRRLEVR